MQALSASCAAPNAPPAWTSSCLGATCSARPCAPLRHVPADLDKGTSTGVCSALVHGDYSRVLIPIWGPAAVDLLVDGYTRAKHGDVRLVARMELGVGVDQPAAFAVCRDLLTV